MKRSTSRRLRDTYGPWAVVTGASSGIGRALATELAGAGLDLVLVARGRPALESTARELAGRHGVHTRVLPLDLAHPDGPATVATATADLDVGLLVAAAGFGTSGEFLDGDLDDELAMLRLNCHAPMILSRHYGPRLAVRGRGGIVLLASLVGFQGAPRAAHYAATKAYIQTLGEGLHRELRPRGVDVLACAPGPVHSGFAARAGMRMGTALTPAQVAVPTLRALGRRTTVAPGALSKLLTWSLAPLPRTTRTRIMGQVMRGMTRPTEPAGSGPGGGNAVPPSGARGG